MGWKLLIGFVVLCAVGAGGLAFYGAGAGPEKHPIEQVLPESQFPR